MRLKKREVKDFNKIVDMIDHCEVVRLGIITDTVPYIVPVSFGYDVNEGKITIYFHGAKEGRKYELMKMNPIVSVEFDSFLGYKVEDFGYTCQYECVMAQGKVEELTDKEEAMMKVMQHCGFSNFDHCTHLDRTALFQIELENISAKKRV